MKKISDSTSMELHIKEWQKIEYPFTHADLNDLERIYNCKAPSWARKEVTAEEQ